MEEAGLLTHEYAIIHVACDYTSCPFPQTDSNKTSLTKFCYNGTPNWRIELNDMMVCLVLKLFTSCDIGYSGI